MKWKHAVNDDPPFHTESVLIAVGGTYYIAVYDQLNRRFIVQNQRAGVFYIDKEEIYWTEFKSPPNAE